MQNIFIGAIHSKNKVLLKFFSKEDGTQISRICAPMDFGPSRRAKDKSDRFHFWDFKSDIKNHTLSLLPDQVISIDLISENFSPFDFITWNTLNSPWYIKREWGVHS